LAYPLPSGIGAMDLHYAFVAIASDVGPIYVDTSADLIHWNVSDKI
jgi:hypothetical protein